MDDRDFLHVQALTPFRFPNACAATRSQSALFLRPLCLCVRGNSETAPLRAFVFAARERRAASRRLGLVVIRLPVALLLSPAAGLLLLLLLPLPSGPLRPLRPFAATFSDGGSAALAPFCGEPPPPPLRVFVPFVVNPPPLPPTVGFRPIAKHRPIAHSYYRSPWQMGRH
jgi:hypothetical protein